MGKKFLTTMAIMIAITLAAPSIFAASSFWSRSVVPDKAACFYDSDTGDYISIATKKVANLAGRGYTLKVAAVNGMARLSTASADSMLLSGTALAGKGKRLLADGTRARWKSNHVELVGGTGTDMRTIVLDWGTDTDEGPRFSMKVYDPATTTYYNYPSPSTSMTKINCKDLSKL
ncbi:hypothetical protein BMS3Abin13_01087 [bacterium BMS3Abin13]|nr:hypothetical protein BMS3Abin13_01087 [bacterium BMS3Abin13]